jgi:hypothetical protein
MAAKAKASSRASAPAVLAKLRADYTPSSPLTLEERVQRIEAMQKRIDGYVQFMCKIATMAGTSGEMKERAITLFYEQMVAVEKQLGHIHDTFRLE